MPSLSKRAMREVRDRLAALAATSGDPALARLIAVVERSLKARSVKRLALSEADEQRYREKVRAHRAEVAAMREAVWRRSRGCCEACGKHLLPVEGELDHWLGGFGRRLAEECVESTWRLCRGCHDERHANKPSAAHWNDVFRDHCGRYGYEFKPHAEKSPVEYRQ